MISIKPKGYPVLSSQQLDELFKELEHNESGDQPRQISLDLNLTEEEIILDFESKTILFPDGNVIAKPDGFDPDLRVCYFVNDNSLFPLRLFDDETNFYYHLVPTSFRPILRISATQMHKKPFLDYLQKVRLKGVILDAGTGLGYSATILSKTASKVITVEWDRNVIEMASFNPHSQILFENNCISLFHDDITNKIKEFDDYYFDHIIHDGGMPKSSGGFFSQSHATQLYRVLKHRGRVHFYLPRKGVSKGKDFALEQIKRMKRSGFRLKSRDMDGSYCIFIKN